MEKLLASRYYRATMATGEEEVFSSLAGAERWIEKVRHTFCLPDMAYEIREVCEWIVKHTGDKLVLKGDRMVLE